MLSGMSDIVVCLNEGPGCVAVAHVRNGHHRSRGKGTEKQKCKGISLVSLYTTDALTYSDHGYM